MQSPDGPYARFHPVRKLNELFRAGRLCAVAELCRENLERARESQGGQHDIIFALEDLAQVHAENRNYDLGADCLSEAVERIKGHHGEMFELHASLLSRFGHFRLLVGCDDEAQELLHD